MKKAKKIIALVICIIVVCTSIGVFVWDYNSTIHSEEIYYVKSKENVISLIKKPLELNEVVDSSAVCVLVSTDLFKKETVKREGVYYSLVEVIDSSKDDIPQIITVVHKAAQLKKSGTFILFLNPVHQCSEECRINKNRYTVAFDEHSVYYMSGAETGAIEVVEENDGVGSLSANKEDSQKEVENLIGKTTEDFYAWFEQKYAAPESNETETTVSIPETTQTP